MILDATLHHFRGFASNPRSKMRSKPFQQSQCDTKKYHEKNMLVNVRTVDGVVERCCLRV